MFPYGLGGDREREEGGGEVKGGGGGVTVPEKGKEDTQKLSCSAVEGFCGPERGGERGNFDRKGKF